MVTTTNLSFHRLDISPYQGKDFKEEEAKALSALGVKRAQTAAEAQILISNTHTDFSKLSESELTKTELLIHPNSGYDNIPCEFVKSSTFPILSGNSIRAHGVSEYILAKLFTHFSHISHQPNWEASRQWNRKRLIDQKVLILGNGLIGKILEKSLSSLVKELVIYDPFKKKDRLDLNGVNVVLVAASLNPSSHKMIDKNFLMALEKDWVLINGARGKIVDQEALFKILEENVKATAYLDVFYEEPFNKIEIGRLPNLIASSHIAGVSANLDQLIIDFEKQVLKDFITHRSNLTEFRKIYANLLLSNKLSPDNSFLI